MTLLTRSEPFREFSTKTIPIGVILDDSPYPLA